MYYNTLELYAYGTYNDYKLNRDKYLELTEAQLKKLKMLSILSIATNNKIVSYQFFQDILDINSIRELEDIIIEAIYNNLIQGKLDQKSNVFKVKSVSIRDIHPSSLDTIIEKLIVW